MLYIIAGGQTHERKDNHRSHNPLAYYPIRDAEKVWAIDEKDIPDEVASCLAMETPTQQEAVETWIEENFPVEADNWRCFLTKLDTPLWTKIPNGTGESALVDGRELLDEASAEAESTLQALEKGAASLTVKVEDGCLTVRHGSNGDLLVKRKMYRGEWDDLFDLLRMSPFGKRIGRHVGKAFHEFMRERRARS